jgi:CarD family transcriptional regulator
MATRSKAPLRKPTARKAKVARGSALRARKPVARKLETRKPAPTAAKRPSKPAAKKPIARKAAKKTPIAKKNLKAPNKKGIVTKPATKKVSAAKPSAKPAVKKAAPAKPVKAAKQTTKATVTKLPPPKPSAAKPAGHKAPVVKLETKRAEMAAAAPKAVAPAPAPAAQPPKPVTLAPTAPRPMLPSAASRPFMGAAKPAMGVVRPFTAPGVPLKTVTPIVIVPRPNEKPPFGEGDWVVYPTHGVGKILGIETQEIAGFQLSVFVVHFEKDRMTLRVPLAKAKNSGLRKLSSRKEMDAALTKLKGRSRAKRTMWSRRAQEYEAKINSGDPASIAEVVRDLHRNSGQPEQSYSERQIYQAALDRLVREFAAVEKIDEATATKRIEQVLQAA